MKIRNTPIPAVLALLASIAWSASAAEQHKSRFDLDTTKSQVEQLQERKAQMVAIFDQAIARALARDALRADSVSKASKAAPKTKKVVTP